ncbi:hypothetical protein BaRGS_00005818 [Batillaria attramentaria]|uniref:Uncharacterized protein n=1 Tax=Batillaria attramentaria TaxID=370345 RepID=A0ABD0LV28_9CAEN
MASRRNATRGREVVSESGTSRLQLQSVMVDALKNVRNEPIRNPRTVCLDKCCIHAKPLLSILDTCLQVTKRILREISIFIVLIVSVTKDALSRLQTTLNTCSTQDKRLSEYQKGGKVFIL